jgi:hypothetical protein
MEVNNKSHAPVDFIPGDGVLKKREFLSHAVIILVTPVVHPIDTE